MEAFAPKLFVRVDVAASWLEDRKDGLAFEGTHKASLGREKHLGVLPSLASAQSEDGMPLAALNVQSFAASFDDTSTQSLIQSGYSHILEKSYAVSKS